MAEAGKSVFSILASAGPGGAIAVLAEKLFRRVFLQGYELGDEHEFRAAEDVGIRKLRQDFVNELFDLKADFEDRVP